MFENRSFYRLFWTKKVIGSALIKSWNRAKTHNYPLIHSDRIILLLFFNWKNQHRHDEPRNHLRDLASKKRDFFNILGCFRLLKLKRLSKSKCFRISSACRSRPENIKKPPKTAFFRFFDDKNFISSQDGPQCTKWPTWPLEVCGDRRAYVVFISNTLSLRQMTFKWSCSQILSGKAWNDF